MKKLLLISLLLASANAYSQVDLANFSTSFEKAAGKPTLGVAIPYNGHYDNFDKNVVGISHWNPGYGLNIDTALDERIPLIFVYDTAGVHFLIPGVNKLNAMDYEFTVLLNNQTVITPWSPVNEFTKERIGDMDAGSGITRNYRAGTGQYLTVHLRNPSKTIVSSRVIYFKTKSPVIKSVSTAENAAAFASLLVKDYHFNDQQPNIGWHRQYTSNLSGDTNALPLRSNESNILINLDSKIYLRDALEYMLLKEGKEVRKWSANESDNNFILLKDLPPGDYRILIRYKRQRSSVSELRFSISSTWYKTAAFRAAVSAFLLLLLTCLILLRKYRRQQQALSIANKKADQSAEALQSIHSLLNPHFTFNALNSIQGLVNKGAMNAASEYLSSFGALLRETLKESKTDHIPASKELENLQLYISLELLRYTFTFNLHADPDLDLSLLQLPPFLLQPFVENAIKHGLSKMDGNGLLDLHLYKKDQDVLIKITDNGPGFNANPPSEGYGLSLSKKRITLLNHDYGEELITLQMESNGTATVILLSFKNWL